MSVAVLLPVMEMSSMLAKILMPCLPYLLLLVLLLASGGGTGTMALERLLLLELLLAGRSWIW